MIGFVLGAFVGGAVGVTTMCMCTVAANADKELEYPKRSDPDRLQVRESKTDSK